MKTVKDKVKYFLTTTPHLRDSDDKLIATIYFNEIGKAKLELMNGIDFLRYFADSKLPPAESIRRVRCSLQAKFPELRGKHYDAKLVEGMEVSTKINNEL